MQRSDRRDSLRKPPWLRNRVVSYSTSGKAWGVMPEAESPCDRLCPVCGAVDAREWRRKAALTLVRCGGCGMVFESPLPGEFDSGAFYEGTGAAFYLSPDKLAGDHSPVRYERELTLFRRLVRTGRVLDVGCGTGGFLHRLNQRFAGDYAVHGTDVAGPALDHAEGLGIRIHRGSFLDGPFEADAFDAVTFWAVLEHLAEPKDFLRQAARVLKPGGFCIALVPNIRSLAVRLVGMKYRYILPQHLNYFSKRTLVRLAQEAGGFTVEDVIFTHFNPAVIWQDWRRDEDFVSDSDRAALLKRTNSLKQRRGLAPIRWAYSLAETCLGTLGLTDNVAVVLRKR